MSKSEAVIQNEIRAAINSSGVARLWRNNIGFDKSTKVKYGLAIGSGDLIGIRNDGKFISLEIKSASGKVAPAQLAWVATVRLFGGIAGVARSVDEAFKIIRGENEI